MSNQTWFQFLNLCSFHGFGDWMIHLGGWEGGGSKVQSENILLGLFPEYIIRFVTSKWVSEWVSQSVSQSITGFSRLVNFMGPILAKVAKAIDFLLFFNRFTALKDVSPCQDNGHAKHAKSLYFNTSSVFESKAPDLFIKKKIKRERESCFVLSLF